MRIAFITIAVLALVLFAFCEVGMAYPVAWWLYLFVAIAFAATLIRPVPIRSQLARIGVLTAAMAVIAALYFVEWSSRKPFLRDFDRVRIGMTEARLGTLWLVTWRARDGRQSPAAVLPTRPAH